MGAHVNTTGFPAGLQFHLHQVLPGILIPSERAQRFGPGSGEAVAGREDLNDNACRLKKLSKLSGTIHVTVVVGGCYTARAQIS